MTAIQTTPPVLTETFIPNDNWPELDAGLSSAYFAVNHDAFCGQNFFTIKEINESIFRCEEQIALYECLKNNLNRLNLTEVPNDYQ